MRSRLLRLTMAMAVLTGALAHAQINLPQLPTATPRVLQTPLLRETVGQTGAALQSSVRERARALLRRYPERVERDPRGSPVVRAVIVALTPDAAAIAQAQADGFQLLSDATLQPWGERLVTLLAPGGMSTQRALRQLRDADPGGSYDFDHLFVESADAIGTNAAPGGALPAGTDSSAVRIGMVDSGVDAGHPVFARGAPQLLGCDGRTSPSDHGTAVASLLVGEDSDFRGAAPGAQLVAVDVYCGGTEPGGRVRDIASGLALLAQRGVRVINLSFVGPHNVVLERVVRRVQQADIVIVAAAGNDGPNAAPLYPAAYSGVIAVTAVDARNKVLLEACRGDHVMFAAPGADMVAATTRGGYAIVRGTSYASPLVAGLLARELAGGVSTPSDAQRRLAGSALDQGRRGRDRSYGLGVVAAGLRTAPANLSAKPADR